MGIFRKEKILFREETQFNSICVIQRGNIITLWSGNNKQTEIKVDGPFLIRPNLEYSRNCFLSLAFCPDPGSILVLGLGGGIIPTLFHSILESAVIDVVEIDPKMREVAQRYFYFSLSERLRLFINDAFFFLRDINKIYDLLIMDAYIGNQLPETIDSTAFLAEAARALSPKGIFVANLMNARKQQFRNMLERIARIFKDIWLLPCIMSTNTLVFAAREKILKSEILERAMALSQRMPFEIKLSRLVNRLENITPS